MNHCGEQSDIWKRPNWDEYGLILAEAAASRAACNRSRVGAVLMSRDHRVLGVGYNGTDAGEVNCTEGGCPRGQLSYAECPALGSYSNCRGRHAEENAIRNSRYLNHKPAFQDTPLRVYVTREPCQDCYQFTYIAGVRFWMWPDGKKDLRFA